MSLEGAISALYAGLRQIPGLCFPDLVRFESPLEVYKAFISNKRFDIPVRYIPVLFIASLSEFLRICLLHSGVYRRDVSRRAYFAVIQCSWDSPHLLDTQDIKNFIQLIKNARTAYIMCDASSPYPGDHTVRHVLRLVDKLSRLTKSLVDPDMEHQMAMFPLSFGSLDLAVVEEQRVWKELFPFSKPNETLGDQIDKYPTGVVRSATKNYPKDPLVRKAELKIDTYPTATSDPITKRTYLCRLALAADTAAAKRHALFLAPIAFLIHRHRQDWYQVTSHKSRYYATIRDFLVYAEDFFGGSRNTLQDHLPALITPWFFSAASVTRHASITNRTAEETWEKACFRVGFVFLLSRLETRAQAGDHERRQYRLLIYKPGVAPRPLTKANSHLLGLQTGWINHAIGMIKKHYELDEIWSRGNTEFNNKGFCLDPMAASAKFIENIMLRYPGIPMKHSELLAKNFIQFPNHSRVWY